MQKERQYLVGMVLLVYGWQGSTAQADPWLDRATTYAQAADEAAISEDVNAADIEKNELQLVAREKVEESSAMMAFYLGQVIPWTQAAVSYVRMNKSNYGHGVAAGVGSFPLNGVEKSRSYNLDTKTAVLTYQFRYFIPWMEAISTNAYLGAIYWSGDMKATSSDATEEDQKLTSSFKAQGVNVGVSVNYTSVYNSGYFLDWGIMGLQKGFIIKKSHPVDSSLVKKALDSQFEDPNIFGIINVGFGYLF